TTAFALSFEKSGGTSNLPVCRSYLQRQSFTTPVCYVALRSEAVQIERRLSRPGLLHANEPFEIVGEAKPRWIIRLLIEQSESVLAAYPELPFVVVRILVHVLLDRYRAIRRRLGVFRIDLVTNEVCSFPQFDY